MRERNRATDCRDGLAETFTSDSVAAEAPAFRIYSAAQWRIHRRDEAGRLNTISFDVDRKPA